MLRRFASFVWLPVLAMAAVAGLQAQDGRAEHPSRSDRLVIHEWGTFTSLQDEDGRTLAGINTDDEPVPEFVHRILDFPRLVTGPSALAPVFFKALPPCHPDALMRLETPVMYFYPPAGSPLPPVDIEVRFRGGWLTEFYPDAVLDAPGFDGRRFGPISARATGTLRWDDVRIGSDVGQLPATDAHVWLAPRDVAAADVTVGHERERYLFYRGVGNLEAPLQVRRSPSANGRGDELLIVADPQVSSTLEAPLRIPALWLVDVRDSGSVAWRRLPGRAISPSGQIIMKKEAPIAAQFPAADYDHAHLADLRADMHAALVEDGLFRDEAAAMLSTWEAAYFASPGLRLFFLMPQAWTDRVLPLHVSVPADITRTMVGRIELVTPAQRELLDVIAAGPASTPAWLTSSATEDVRTAIQRLSTAGGPVVLDDVGIRMPADYAAYVRLGRFRNALLLAAARNRPMPGLSDFTRNYRIAYYQPPVVAQVQ